MRVSGFLVALVIMGAVFFVSAPAAAFSPTGSSSGAWYEWFWPPKVKDQSKVYKDDGKIPHAYLSVPQGWTPAEWIEDRGSVQAVVDDLYNARIITHERVKDNTASLRVGPGFFDLSPQDRYKVISFMDYAYGDEADGGNRVIALQHHRTKAEVGYYTKGRLYLQ